VLREMPSRAAASARVKAGKAPRADATRRQTVAFRSIEPFIRCQPKFKSHRPDQLPMTETLVEPL
jgi:hypothetical protein